MGTSMPINLIFQAINCYLEAINIMDPGVNTSIIGFILNLSLGLMFNFGYGLNLIPISGLQNFSGFGF